jgi:hypothetical protein
VLRLSGGRLFVLNGKKAAVLFRVHGSTVPAARTPAAAAVRLPHHNATSFSSGQNSQRTYH